MSSRREDLAWLAGIMDGEGSFIYCGSGDRPTLQVVVSNTYLPLLERVHLVLGCGNIYAAKPGPWKQQYQWRVGAFERVQAIVALTWPFLSGQKREQAATMLRRYRDHPVRRGRWSLDTKEEAA